MAHYYRVPVHGSGTPEDPYHPAHEADLSADPSNYNRHYRSGAASVVIAANNRLTIYEDLAEDDDTAIEVLDDADAYPDTDDDGNGVGDPLYPAPEDRTDADGTHDADG